MLEAVAPEAARSYSAAAAPVACAPFRLSPDPRFGLTLVFADLATVLLAAMAAYAFYIGAGIGRRHYDPAVYLRLGLVYTAVTAFALHGYGAYRDEAGLLRIEAVQKILRAVLAGIVLTLGLSFLARLPSFSRLTFLLVVPVTIVALVAQRALIWKLLDRSRAGDPGVRRVLIYGAGQTGRLLAQQLLHEHPLGLQPVGFLDDDAALVGREIRVGAGIDGDVMPVLGTGEMLEPALRMTGAAAVFLATPSASPQRIHQLFSRIESLGAPVFVVPSAGDLLLSTLRFGQIAGIPIFTRRRPNRARLYLLSKRLIDLVGSAALLLLTAPLLLLGALLVRLTSPGPVLFAQERVGLDGRPFTIYKLRTMRRDAPRYALHPDSPDDGRVTAAGRLLRRLSLDELPQLFNVLRGEMSLVGPRPEMSFVVEGYTDTERQRLSVKPGLTGLWQISADRAFKIHDNIHYDLYYVERCSTMLDIAILCVTPFVLLAKNRAK
jgi:exopolysaccharide biosynthesis polyprenyl glycosylphosphotransferase